MSLNYQLLAVTLLLSISLIAIQTHASTGILVAVDVATDELISIDTTTGVGTSISPLGRSTIEGLAYDQKARTLYAVDGQSDQLLAIDHVTGTIVRSTPIVGLGFAQHVQGLAYDNQNDTLFGVFNQKLVSIDPTTGILEQIGSSLLFRLSAVDGLAYDPLEGTLFATTRFNIPNDLYSIDPTDASSALIGSIGFSGVYGLAFDPASDTLYGIDRTTDSLIVVDQTSGQGSRVGSFGAVGFDAVLGLTFIPVPEPSAVILLALAAVHPIRIRRKRS